MAVPVLSYILHGKEDLNTLAHIRVKTAMMMMVMVLEIYICMFIYLEEV